MVFEKKDNNVDNPHTGRYTQDVVVAHVAQNNTQVSAFQASNINFSSCNN